MTKSNAKTRRPNNKILNDLVGEVTAETCFGIPAPDICCITTTLSDTGDLKVQINTYTKNTFSHNFSIETGMENGSPRKGKNNSPLLITQSILGRLPSVDGEKSTNYKIHPAHSIIAFGWDYLENKDYLIEKNKESIHAALTNIFDMTKEKMVKLMHPNASPEAGIEQEKTPGVYSINIAP